MQSPWARQFQGELRAACQQDDVNAIKDLTTHNPPQNWSSILAFAATASAIHVATYCLQHGATVGQEVLNYVISSDRSEPIYRYFVDSGYVDVDYDIEWRGTMLGAMASQGRNSLVEYLLSKGADPNCRVESMLRKTALACAAGRADEMTLGLLLDYGATLNGSGALVFAAQRGKVENVRFLLAKGADIDEMGIEDPADRRSLEKLGTPLHKAVEAGHSKVVEILSAAGANDQLKDAQGRTAADIDNARAESVFPSSSKDDASKA